MAAASVSVGGLLLAALSMIGNGTFGIFGKLCKAEPDPIIFNSCLALGVLISSPLAELLFCIVTGSWVIGWTWPGALAGCLLVVATLFSFVAISLTGLATAQASWSCAAILVAFCWGALGPRRQGHGPGQPIKSLGPTIVAVVLLVAGVVVINNSGKLVECFSGRRQRGKAPVPDCSSARDCTSIEATAVPTGEGCSQSRMRARETESTVSTDAEAGGPSNCGGGSPSAPATSPLSPETQTEPGSAVKASLGLLAAIMVGVSGGSILVPAAFVEKRLAGMHMMLSFGVAAGFSGVLVGVLYWKLYQRESLSLRAGSRLAVELRREVVLYGIVSGFFWNAGNICQILAMDYFHMPYGISYPILQCGLVVAGSWGIFFFKEVTSRSQIAVFFAGVAVLLLGVIGLSLFGPGS